MSHAVYLVSSFPMLRFGDIPPFTVADLRKKCEGMLTEKELENLDALIEGRDCDDSFIAAFQAHEIQVVPIVRILPTSGTVFSGLLT